jgi:Uma2 family endonuclease
MTSSTDTIPMVIRADRVPGAVQGCWTYDSYAAIPDDGKRYEVVNGVLYVTSAPNVTHQGSNIRIASQLLNHVEFACLGRVFAAPIDVELATGVVVQPDVVVVLKARLGIITEKRIIGTPDLVVEIASPSTAGYDRRTKQDAYASARVPEYWLVDPYAHTVEVLRLEGDAYQSAGVVEGESAIPAHVLPGLPAHAEQFFA